MGLKTHRYNVVCPKYGGPSLVFAKSLKDDYNCQYCDSNISLDDLDDEAIDAMEENEL